MTSPKRGQPAQQAKWLLVRREFPSFVHQPVALGKPTESDHCWAVLSQNLRPHRLFPIGVEIIAPVAFTFVCILASAINMINVAVSAWWTERVYSNFRPVRSDKWPMTETIFVNFWQEWQTHFWFLVYNKLSSLVGKLPAMQYGILIHCHCGSRYMHRSLADIHLDIFWCVCVGVLVALEGGGGYCAVY